MIRRTEESQSVKVEEAHEDNEWFEGMSCVRKKKSLFIFLEKLGQKPKVEVMKTFVLAVDKKEIFASALSILSI